jgi:type IV pilus assembly protein PilM
LSSLDQQLKELFAKFGIGGATGILGVDIGYSGIKLCELEFKGKKPKLKNFVYSPLAPGVLVEDDIQDRDTLIDSIIAAVEEADTDIKDICFGLFGNQVVTKRLSVPEGTKEELEDNIIWESEQYIPFDPDDATVKFDILGKNQGGGLDVIMAAAHFRLIEDWQDIIKESGLNPSIVDLSVFALNNIFESSNEKNLQELSTGTIVIDVGAMCTRILIYKNNGPYLTKEIPIGGFLVSEEIQRVMGVSFEEAEALKSSVDEEGNLPEEIEAVIDDVIGTFIEEIKKTLNFFISASSTENVYYCYMTGGSCRLPGFVEALSELVEMEIAVLDCFQTVEYDKKKFDEDAIAEINFIGAVALGLALRGAG